MTHDCCKVTQACQSAPEPLKISSPTNKFLCKTTLTCSITPTFFFIVAEMSSISLPYLGKFVAVRGTVVRVSSVKPLVTHMAFSCNTCKETQVRENSSLIARIIYCFHATEKRFGETVPLFTKRSHKPKKCCQHVPYFKLSVQPLCTQLLGCCTTLKYFNVSCEILQSFL